MKNKQTHLILILLSLSFFSCGKETNTVVEQPPQYNEPGQPEEPSSPCPSIVHNKEDLISALNNAESFPDEPYSPYSYQHWECTISGFFQSCGTIGVPLRLSSRDTEGINHELASTKERLLRVLSNAASKSKKHKIRDNFPYPLGTTHQVTANSSHKHPIWIINLCLPLVANPIVKKNVK